MLGTWHQVKEKCFGTASFDSSENYHGEFSLGTLRYLSTAFFTLHIFSGYILLPSLFLTFTLSKRVRRPATILNFWATLAIYSISYSLLLYTRSRTLHPSNFTLCLIQAAMIHGAPPMVSVAGFGVVVQVYAMYMLPLRYSRFESTLWWMTTVVVLPPYATFVAFAIATAYLGLKNPQHVWNPTGLWCTLSPEVGPFQLLAVGIFCAAMYSACVLLEVVMVVQYVRRRVFMRKLFPFSDVARPSLSPLLRVVIFTLGMTTAEVSSILFLARQIVKIRYIAPAILPAAAAIIFGSHRDTFYVWFSWARRSKHASRREEYRLSDGGWSAGTPQFVDNTTLT